jgi:hypothetical protein
MSRLNRLRHGSWVPSHYQDDALRCGSFSSVGLKCSGQDGPRQAATAAGSGCWFAAWSRSGIRGRLAGVDGGMRWFGTGATSVTLI